MIHLAILGRQPEISLAELKALYSNVKKISNNLATFTCAENNFKRLGGTLKVAELLEQKPLEYLTSLPQGKITLGVSDYSEKSSKKTSQKEALKLKKILTRHGRSIRVLENKEAILSTATSIHNGIGSNNPRKIELIKVNSKWYKVVFVQDIDTYARRDQARPARDAYVGMLPPKLAQILINLAGPFQEGSTVLDPFCGTGVILQEALLMGYHAYGTDKSEKMVEYSEKNLKWLLSPENLKRFFSEHRESLRACSSEPCEDRRKREREEKNLFRLSTGDATTFKWTSPIDAVACEGYLGKPFSSIPTEIQLKEQKQECEAIIQGFLKNLAPQIKPNTPVIIAIPAWLRPDGTYERLNIAPVSQKEVDNLSKLGYNVSNISRKGLLYCRESQIVARDIIILRKN